MKNTAAAPALAGQPEQSTPEVRSLLDQLAREGARNMLAAALEAEVQDFLDRHRHLRDEAGRRQVVRNGHLPEREVLTGAGPLPIRQPRVRDRRGKDHPEAVSFSSAILPPYLRRSSSIDELVPWHPSRRGAPLRYVASQLCAASAPATSNRPCRRCSGLKLRRCRPPSSAA